jgi:hypothetical protein
MFEPLLNVRLVIIDSCNQVADDEQAATAEAWVDILELEASRLIDGQAAWLPAGAGQQTALRRRHAHKWARMLGQTDARLSLILADQIVAALIRGHLQGVQT